MMKKRNLIAFTLIAITGMLALSTSMSLAWYISSSNLKVNTITVSMKTERELKISTSTDLETFKDELTYEELNDVDLFYPVSSMYESEWMKAKSSSPIFYDASTTLYDLDGVPFLTPARGGYFSQSLYLMCDDDVWVTFDPSACWFKSNEQKNVESADFLQKNYYKDKSIEEITSGLDSLINALRVSILIPDVDTYNYFVFDPYKEGETLLGGILDNNKDGYYDVYTSSDGISREVLYGEITNREKAIYDAPSGEDILTSGELSCFNANIYGMSEHFNKEESFNNGLIIKEENSLEIKGVDTYESPFRIPLKRDTPKEIVLSIYIEGWDLDCTNINMGANFLGELTFKILREM